MSELPKIPASLLSGTSGVIPQAQEPKVRKLLGDTGNKRTETARKMQALRLQATMQALHFTACDTGAEHDTRIEAATQLAMSMNTHFELVIWALRVAGGAARP